MNGPFIRILALALLVAAGLAAPALAKDLGVRGVTWAIAEPDLLATLEARLEALRDAGAFERMERAARARARARLESPPRVAGMTPAVRARSRLLDPAVTVARDVVAPDGTRIARAGTRVHPFDYRPLDRALLFLDGTRAVEVAWALRQRGPATLVLVAGAPLALARAHGRRFFFDQGGALSRRLGIAATPTLVTREGRHLRLREVALEDDAGGTRE